MFKKAILILTVAVCMLSSFSVTCLAQAASDGGTDYYCGSCSTILGHVQPLLITPTMPEKVSTKLTYDATNGRTFVIYKLKEAKTVRGKKCNVIIYCTRNVKTANEQWNFEGEKYLTTEEYKKLRSDYFKTKKMPKTRADYESFCDSWKTKINDQLSFESMYPDDVRIRFNIEEKDKTLEGNKLISRSEYETLDIASIPTTIDELWNNYDVQGFLYEN